MGFGRAGISPGAVCEALGETTLSRGTEVVSSGSANAMGAWKELTTATGIQYEWQGFYLASNNSFATSDRLMDVGIGAPGSEEIIVNKTRHNSRRGAQTFYYPLRVAKGSRMYLRCQDANTSARNIYCMLLGHGGSLGMMPGYSICRTYGQDTTTSKGTTCDAGGVANTKTYTELTASTVRPIKALGVFISNNNNANLAAAQGLFTVAIGGAGSEIDIYGPHPVWMDTSADNLSVGYINVPVQIPTGSRISIGWQSSIIDIDDRKIDALVHGYT